jgi:hypothetical protein
MNIVGRRDCATRINLKGQEDDGKVLICIDGNVYYGRDIPILGNI